MGKSVAYFKYLGNYSLLFMCFCCFGFLILSAITGNIAAIILVPVKQRWSANAMGLLQSSA